MDSGEIDSKLNEIYNNAMASARLAHLQSQGENKEYSSGAYGRLSSDGQRLINRFLAGSRKNTYNMLVGALLYKVACPDRNIRYWTNDHGSYGWPRKGYNLNKFIGSHVKQFLYEKNFQRAYDPSYKKYISGPLVRNPTLEFGNPDSKATDMPRFQPFLNIIKEVRDNGRSPEKYLQAMFEVELYQQLEHTRQKVVFRDDVSLTCHDIEEVLNEHLYTDYTYRGKSSGKGTSKLPVLMIHSLCETLLNQGGFPNDVWLEADRPHTANDTRDDECGDVTLRRPDGSIYEAIDVKGKGARLKADDIVDARNKIAKCGGVETAYRFVYTDPPNSYEMEGINKEIEKAANELHCDIYVMSIQEYMNNRLPNLSRDNRQKFLETYRNYLEKDATKDGFHELQDSHRKEFAKILENHGIAKVEGKDKGKDKLKYHSESRSESSESISRNRNKSSKNIIDFSDKDYSFEDLGF